MQLETTKDAQIILNRIQTPDGTILTSHHTHDYVTHIDANGEWYMVDGGKDYLKRSVNNVPYTELSVYSDAPFEVIRKSLYRGSYGKRGEEKLKYVLLKDMSDDHIDACISYNKNYGYSNSIASKMYQKEIDYRKENNISIKD